MASTLGAIVLFTAFLDYQRVLVWAGPIQLWEDSVAKSPENWRANFQLAYAYYDAQRCTDADQQYAKTAALKEPDYRLLVDWALAIDCAGRPGDAVVKLQEAAAIEPSAHVYATIAMMYGKQGQNKEALEALDQAQKLDRRFAITYFYRGNVYAAMGDHAQAASQYGLALKRDPGLEAARRGLERSEQMVRQMLGP
jgi:tetratricopeptide (TPR) repeat protein